MGRLVAEGGMLRHTSNPAVWLGVLLWCTVMRSDKSALSCTGFPAETRSLNLPALQLQHDNARSRLHVAVIASTFHAGASSLRWATCIALLVVSIRAGIRLSRGFISRSESPPPNPSANSSAMDLDTLPVESYSDRCVRNTTLPEEQRW